MELGDKVAVVTGGGNGIGREVVLELIRRRARVAAVDIRRESLDETARLADAGGRLVTMICDITDRAAVESLPAKVVDHLGPIDLVVNTAGIIQPFVPLKDLGYDAIDRVIALNLFGTIHVAKAFLPHLLERPAAHLATVSSMGGFLPVPGQTMYGATKAAVKLMTEGLYAELMDTNVGVSVVMPGAVSTNITGNSGVAVPAGAGDRAARARTTSPEVAARIILDGIQSGRLHIHVGRDSRLMSVLNRAAPKRSTHLIQRQMKRLLEP